MRRPIGVGEAVARALLVILTIVTVAALAMAADPAWSLFADLAHAVAGEGR